MSNFKMADDYIDVAARIAEFRTKHPEGSLQPADPAQPYRVERIGDQTFIVAVAAAYRDREDTRPGIGMAYEQFPGRTPYTKGSELQNAETSAWGRAIVAALAADTKKGIASADEVRNRSAERDAQVKAVDPLLALKVEIAELGKSLGWGVDALKADYADRFGGQKLDEATEGKLIGYREALKAVVARESATPQSAEVQS